MEKLKLMTLLQRLKNHRVRYSTVKTGSKTVLPKEIKQWNEIPGPSSLPVIDQIHHFLPKGSLYGLDIQALLDTLYNKYGPIVRVNGMLGKPPMLYLFDATCAADILRGENLLPRRPILESLEYYKAKHTTCKPGRLGLIADHGEGWKNLRSTVNPVLLKPKAVKLYEAALSEVADVFIKRLQSKLDQQNMIKDTLDYEITLWALESIGVVALGGRLNCLDSYLAPDSPELKLISYLHEISSEFDELDVGFSLWRYYPTKTFRRAMKVYEDQEACATYFIEKALKDFLKPNIEESKKGVLQKLYEIDEEIAVVTACDMLFAGVDTTANAMLTNLYLLATNPEKQEKLREDIISKSGLKYLKACMKESMRVLPTVSRILRKINKDYVILGYRIPKDSMITIANQSMSVMEKHYPQPFEYIPERWIVSKDDPLYHGNANPFATIPFGFGVRGCIGKRIADLELEILLTKLIQNFKIEWFGPPIKINSHFVNHVAPPFNFKFSKILSN